MVALQSSIGALNDLVDAGSDAGRKPGKPIPTGLVSRREAQLIVAIGAGFGLVLAAGSGPGTLALATIVLGVGYAYDLVAKGTPWSWLPFAVGIPLLPVFGWFGATGSLSPAFGILVPAAVAAGAGLAVANARADLERDVDAGIESVAVRLGLQRAWVFEATLLGAVIVVAIGSLWVRSAGSLALGSTVGAALVVVAGIVWGRSASVHRRERGWEAEAIGIAALAAAWLVGFGDVV